MLLFFLFSGLSWFSLSQDTLRKYVGYNGFNHVEIVQNKDTILHTFYPDNALESKKSLSKEKVVIYERYYPNGKLMWKQELKNDKAHGLIQLFGNDGILLTSLLFKNDTITDTLFSQNNRPVIFGQFTSSWIAHRSIKIPNEGYKYNSSGGSGVRKFTKMYLVKQDSNLILQKKFKELCTDQNGFFFCEVEKGNYGIFPENFPIDKVKATMGTSNAQDEPSANVSWSQETPIDITQTNFLYLPLHCRSVDLAP